MIIPDGTLSIGKLAFAYNRGLKAIYLPDSVNEIAEDFIYSSPNVVICCNRGSYAEQFAIDHDLKYCIDYR